MLDEMLDVWWKAKIEKKKKKCVGWSKIVLDGAKSCWMKI